MTSLPRHSVRRPLLALALALACAPATATQQTDANPAARAAAALLEARNPATADTAATQQLLVATLTELPAHSPLSAPLVGALVRLRDELADPAGHAADLHQLLEGPLHGVARDTAERGLFDTLRDLGRFEAARALRPQRDQVREMLAIGPFGDQGDFYLDALFAPELDFPALGVSLPGRYGPVQPHVARAEPASAFVDLVDPVHPDREGCFYGLHRFALPAATSGWIELVSAGSLKVWLNGTEVARIDRLAERAPQQLFLPAAFAAGENHLLVKTGLAARSSVALRYVDARGEPLEGLRMLPATAPEQRPGAASTPVPGRFVQPLDLLTRAARDAGEPAGPLAAAAALIAVTGGALDLAATLLHAAEPVLENVSEPAVLLAWASVYERITDLPAELRSARARALVDRACAAAPEHFSAVSWRARLLLQDDQLEDAVRALDALPDDGPAIFTARIQARSRLQDRAAVRRLLREATERFPWSRSSVVQALRTQMRFGITPDLEERLATALTVTPGAPELLALERDLAAACGESERALRAFTAGRFPAVAIERPADLLRRADLHLTLQDRAAARADMQRALQHPLVTNAQLRRAGRALVRIGAREPGVAALRRALEREPGDVALRRELACLLDLPAFPLLDGERLSTTQVETIAAAYQPGEAERGASSTLVVDRMVTRMLPDGSWFQEVHELRRINDRSGVEAHEQQSAAAGADEVVRLRTLGTDGKSYVPQRVADTFAMPRVEPGAFIEAVYRRYFDAPGADVVDGPTFLFQGESEPFVRTELVHFVPAGAPGELRSRGLGAERLLTALDGPPADVAGDLSGHRRLQVRRDDVPRPKVERNAPPFAARAPKLQWSEDPDPDAARRSDRVAFQFRTRVSAWIAERTAAVLAGIEGSTARAERIHAFVHEWIASEQGPAEPTPTLLRRQGPRFFLEAAMLRAAGIPMQAFACEGSDRVLDSGDGELFADADPHPMLALRVQPEDGEPRWLFPDLPRYAPLGFVPAGRDGARALDLETGRVLRIAGDADAARGLTVTAEGRLDARGDLQLDATVRLGDVNGLQLAQQIRELPENRRSLVARNFGGQILRGFALRGARIDAPQPGSAFRLAAGLLRQGAAQPDGERLGLALPLPPAQMVAQFGDRGQRTLPYQLRTRIRELWRLEIELASDLQLVALPPRERIRFEGLDYRLDWLIEDGKLVIEREFTLRPMQLAPERFAEWMQLLSRIDGAEARRATLRRLSD